MLDKRAVILVREQREILARRAKALCTWKVIVPAVLFLMFWVFYEWVFELPHAFQKAFAPGDLLLFSALVLMEVTVETDSHMARTEMGGWMPQLIRGFAVCVLVAFGVLKYHVIIIEPHLMEKSGPESAHVLKKMSEYALLNCMVALFAIAYSIRAFSTAAEQETAEWVRRLARE